MIMLTFGGGFGWVASIWNRLETGAERFSVTRFFVRSLRRQVTADIPLSAALAYRSFHVLCGSPVSGVPVFHPTKLYDTDSRQLTPPRNTRSIRHTNWSASLPAARRLRLRGWSPARTAPGVVKTADRNPASRVICTVCGLQ